MKRILVVDDEALLRETLSQILRMHGYETTAVGTVAEALSEITSNQFDVLISDLNIGEASDGFTVVSAMRRVQPTCRTFILTGYPDFASALQAINAQVDDYLIKPADIPSLLAAIERKIENPPAGLSLFKKRLSQILREQTPTIVASTLSNEKEMPAFSDLPLDDHQRVDHLPVLLEELAVMLDSEIPSQTSGPTIQTAAKHGTERFNQGYSIDMLVAEIRVLLRASNDTVQENLLSIDLSRLVTDLKWLEESVFLQLEQSLRSFAAAQRTSRAA